MDWKRALSFFLIYLDVFVKENNHFIKMRRCRPESMTAGICQSGFERRANCFLKDCTFCLNIILNPPLKIKFINIFDKIIQGWEIKKSIRYHWVKQFQEKTCTLEIFEILPAKGVGSYWIHMSSNKQTWYTQVDELIYPELK